MIPWRRHGTTTADSRKFSGIPRGRRLIAFGFYERLCDLIGLHCEWDALVGSRGEPWTLDEIADKSFIGVGLARELLEALARAGLIEAASWTNGVVRVPMLIAYADQWFVKRGLGQQVAAHYEKYGIRPEHVRDRRGRVRGVPIPDVQQPELTDEEVLFGNPSKPGAEFGLDNVRSRKSTGRKNSRNPDAPRNRIRFDRTTGRLTGITDGDREAWTLAYPKVDLERELPRCANWLRDNERKDISATIRTWLENAQADAEAGIPRGGPGGRVASPPPRSADAWKDRKGGVTRRA